MADISRVVRFWSILGGCKELFHLLEWNRFALLRSVQREIYCDALVVNVKFDILNHYAESQQSGFY